MPRISATLWTRLLSIALLLAALLLPSTPAHAQEQPADPDETLYGTVLNWSEDSADAHAQRLGAPAAIYGQNVPFPMTSQEQSYLKAFFAQAAGQGSHALVTVEPRVPLADITPDAATAFADQLADAATNFQGEVYVRFAPEMNAPWVPWGQQPEAYTAAFTAVSSAVRNSLDSALMVWSPTAARDYPFREATSQPPNGAPLEPLDTNDDGVWDQDDAAYDPYYPGDDAVDWVGLYLYYDPIGERSARNTTPDDGDFLADLDPSGSRATDDFYTAYAEDRDKPVMVQTGAFFSPGAPGDTELEIKSSWWDQVLGVSNDDHPQLRTVIWDETVDSRGETPFTIEWGVTGTSEVATAFRTALEESGVEARPVTAPTELAIPATEQPSGTGTVLTGWPAWALAATVLLAVALLWFFSGRAARNRWAYNSDGGRDARIDMLRGMAIVFVVVNHVGISSAFQLFTQETIGVVSGAELFVLLSGAVVGLVYGPRIADELGDVVDRTTSRAWKLYVTALVVVILVYLLSLLPFINAAAVTTFTDQGTGAAGQGAAGTTYDLYAGMEGLLEFPVPAGLIPALLLLQVGPWQFNVMGLYVILLLISPLILAAMARRLTWLVLTVSLALWAVGTLLRPRLLPSQFEDSFPLLVWQVLFVLGLVAGYHRHRIVEWFSHPRRKAVLGLCLVIAAACAVFSWTGPYLSNALDVRLGLLPEGTFQRIYDTYFNRTYLGAGRLLNVLVIVVALYALLSAYWKPLQKALGWFLIPLGQATLYVFIMHVFLILAVANIPALREGDLWLNTAAYVLLLGLLWVMVRTRFLFRLIPR
ncbi:acyltransferase family protein [Arthrobacter sp. JZ12]|uniref:OpgC domain-containing protein n=1 Tax=Arthrobacter sp. JZ12 TaxID=2654190 RepID=UPI002B45B400|nr:OpgC domain-containing protein [Arthrobacter sp. JZ12]WRH24448.1 acyltransferase family protein [Arthrobacter sp. JZ12]